MNTMKENKIIKCVDCRRELIVGARFCKYCGTKVEKQAENDTMVCANCGKNVKKGLFCIQCGHKSEAELSAAKINECKNKLARIEELQMESEQAEYELENSFKKKKIIKFRIWYMDIWYS